MNILDFYKINNFLNKYFGFSLPASKMVVAKCLKLICPPVQEIFLKNTNFFGASLKIKVECLLNTYHDLKASFSKVVREVYWFYRTDHAVVRWSTCLCALCECMCALICVCACKGVRWCFRVQLRPWKQSVSIGSNTGMPLKHNRKKHGDAIHFKLV